MTDPDPGPEASAGARSGSDAAPVHARRGVVRRLVPLVLALGVAGILSPLVDRWPSSHPVEVAIESPRTAQRIELVVRGPEGDDVHQATWNFAPGAAPDRLHTIVSAPDGAYELLVDVHRSDGTRGSRAHRVDLDQGRTIVHTR